MINNAAIIGGGIAGAVAALALQKAGIEAVVYEAYPTGADDVGAFLTIMHNGMDALAAVDAADLVAEVSSAACGVEIYSGSGQKLGEQPYDQNGSTISPRTLRRSELYRVLHDEVSRRGIRVEHGKRLVSAAPSRGDRVTATFADGSTSAAADVLIGADGIKSTTRSIIDPAAPAPRYTGLNVIYGYAPVWPELEPGVYRFFHSKAAFGCITIADHPADSQDQTWWFTRVPAPELTADELASMMGNDWRERARSFFTEDTTPVADIIASTSDTVLGNNVYDLPSTPRWHTQHMVLVGDAAHAASPALAQGASMASEDAVTLARCLRDLPREDAFHVYESLRRPRVERLVASSAERDASRIRPARTQPQTDTDVAAAERRREAERVWLLDHHIEWDAPVTNITTPAAP
ncbi:FAD-dependent monooxygenase [Allokutzneria albata]|uniref:2-polyprenyl-6-methoxyphenol hydroxylase n=1 Tax=Allokutzneria albata TaxID=211114 RepID=A0A1G9Y5Z5_ALLAB|nr:FAD-dependent monooxygenase [Allokutzneria albata]SDN04478.1 2-polyprenyl-6-methoxyphenol hydroxylase [Allokutzneria albata]